jgi:hypothetical protein
MHVFKILAASTMAAALASDALAQCANYSLTPAGTNLSMGDDTVRTVALPFNFPFNGVNYSSITVASNGYIWLGSGTVSDFTDTEAEFLSQAPRIAILWDDLAPHVAGSVRYRADATQASVSWVGVQRLTTVVFANCELVLMPSGEINMYYDATNTWAANNHASGATIVGISRGGGAPASPLSWSTGLTTPPVPIVGATGYELFTNSLGASPFDLAGMTLKWTPTGVDTYDVTSAPLPPCTLPGSDPSLTTQTSVGAGCPKPRAAIYELFTVNTGVNPFDLSNTSIEFVKSGDNYTTMQGPGFDTNYSTNGTIIPGVTDDSESVQSLGAMASFQLGTQSAITQVEVGSNGYIWLPTGATAISASAASFHSAGARVAGFWIDLVPNSTTAPIYWENTNAAYCQATWENVPIFTDGGLHTFQITLKSNGNVVISYLSMTGGTARTPLAGLSGGGGATNIGNTNLATAGVVNSATQQLTGTAGTPMIHTASPLAIGLPFAMSSTVPAPISGAGFFIIGVSNPSIPLDGIGMPGCTQYASLDNTYFLLFGASPMTLTLDIPYNTAFLGVNLFSQAAAFSTLNAFGVIASNGLSHLIGI